MGTLPATFKSGLKLGTNQIIIQVCSFARNIIIARMITPKDYGIAATFAMTYALLDMISNLAAELLLIQAPDGDDPRFQKTAQLLQTVRGIINAALIFACAGPIARLFGIPETRWAFRCVALIPLLRAFTHLDVNRIQRGMRYGPSIRVDLATNLVTTLACVPLALWLRNYSAMLWVLVLQAIVYVIGTHVVADRAYGWAWDRKYVTRIFSFGWPLLINGFLMYVILQGDGVIIGASHRLFPHSHFTLTDLGIYSVAFSLTMAPSMLVANVATSIFLPLLSRVQGQREQLARNYAICAEIVAFMAALIGIPFAIAGSPAIALIYGQKYSAASEVIGWLAAMWAVRIVRVAPTLGAMASGDTRNAMLSNIARTLALPWVVAVAAAGFGLKWIAVCGFCGELLALSVSVRRLQKREDLQIGKCIKPFAVAASATLTAILLVPRWEVSAWPVAVVASTLLAALTCVTMLLLFPELRRYFQNVFLPTTNSKALPI